MTNNSLNPWYNSMEGAVLLGHAVLLQHFNFFYRGCKKRQLLRYKHASSYLKSLLICEKKEHMVGVINKEQWKWSRYKESINNSPGLQLSWKDIISINTIQIINKQLRGWTAQSSTWFKVAWTRGQNIIWKLTPGSIYHGVQNTIWHRSSGPRQVKLCSDRWILKFLFRTI